MARVEQIVEILFNNLPEYLPIDFAVRMGETIPYAGSSFGVEPILDGNVLADSARLFRDTENAIDDAFRNEIVFRGCGVKNALARKPSSAICRCVCVTTSKIS